jgi:hypothetical protein
VSEAVSNFISELSLHFSKRFDSEAAEDQWLDSMRRNLRTYSPSVLKRACQRIVDTRKDRYFPLPAECRRACEEIEKVERAENARPLDTHAHPLQVGADWKYRLADDLIMCGLGKRAAQEGWILSLHDYCRNNGRLPTQEHEIRKCIQDAKGFDQAYEDVLNGNGGALTKALEALGDTMLKRREALREKVLGRAA